MGRSLGGWGRRIAAQDVALSGRLAASKGPLLDHALPFLGRSANYSKLWLAVSAALAASGSRSGRRGAARGLVAIGLASPAANVLAKQYANRARPVADSVPVIRRLRRAPLTTSFPSGHSASAAAFATGVLLENAIVGIPVAVLAAGVAASRVVTAAHFPSDVIAGCAVGAGVGLATLAFWPRDGAHGPQTADAVSADAPAAPTGAGVEIVVNGGSGTASADLADRLRSELPAAIVTQCTGDGFEAAVAQAAGRCEVLGIAGGDGSLSTAAGHALDKDLPLLVIPAGTLNHFARDLGLDDVDGALEALRRGSAVSVDVGTAGSAVFLNTCSAGVYTDLVLARQRFEAGVGKWPAMVLGLGQVLIHGRPGEFVVDGVRRRLWVFFAGNGRYGPDGSVPSYREDLSDGLIDVRLLDADRPLSRLRLLAAVAAGTLRHSRVYEESVVRSVRLDSVGEPALLTLDGEPGPRCADVTIRRVARRLRVYRPESV